MLDKIPLKSSIFIDSNIFIYHFLDVSEPCTNFLEKIELGDIDGIEPKKVIKYLKQNPEIISTLKKCETAINEINEFNVNILTGTVEAIFQSRSIRKEYCQMTNDSLNLYVMILRKAWGEC